MSGAAQLDHLVVAARTLDEGVAWCEAALGVTPGAGGKHALMGTHNRLLSIASSEFPRAYLEIIAIDPDAPDPGRARWFELDDPQVRRSLEHGPRLLHWVARVGAIQVGLDCWRGLGLDAGPVLQASRPTPRGELRWQIAVRDDGRRLLRGALPLLIEWGDVHPADAMPASGVQLRSLSIGCDDGDLALRALRGVGLQGITRHAGSAALTLQLDTLDANMSLSIL